MRRRGSLEHELLVDSLKRAGMSSLVRDRAAEAAKRRDWSRLERTVAVVSVVAMFAIACVAHYAAWQIMTRSLQK
jgi:hypothetical protein